MDVLNSKNYVFYVKYTFTQCLISKDQMYLNKTLSISESLFYTTVIPQWYMGRGSKGIINVECDHNIQTMLITWLYLSNNFKCIRSLKEPKRIKD